MQSGAVSGTRARIWPLRIDTAKALSARTSTAAPRAADRFVVADGTLEVLKWFALGLMALDHANKYLFNEGSAVLFDLGRMVMPFFGFVLMYHLARPGAMAAGMHLGVMRRLLVFGALVMPAFVALVGWWPPNILFMLLLATAIVWLTELGGAARIALAVLAFVVAGAVVEFWWFGVLSCLVPGPFVAGRLWPDSLSGRSRLHRSGS